MEARQLTAFLAVAEELHFSRAAERLHMAQPPLSQQIRRLERELGIPLFERSTRSVRLTSAGRSLVEPARAALESLRNAERVVRAAGRGEVGSVRMGFAGASSHEKLPPLAMAVRDAHPGIALRLEGRVYSDVVYHRLADGSLDLGFVHHPNVSPGDISTRPLSVEELVAAVPAGHPAAARDRVGLAELADESFVSLPADAGSSVHNAMLRACRDAGFSPRVAQVAPDSLTQIALVAAGVGIALTLSSWRQIKQPGVAYLELAGSPILLQTALAWRTDDASPALRAVLTLAERVFPVPADAAMRDAIIER